MKTLYVSILGMCLFADSLGQNYHKIDSLKQILLTAKEDTLKGLAIWSLVDEYMWNRPDTGLYFANMGLELIKDKRIKSKFDISKNHLLYSFQIRMYAKGAIAASLQRNDSLALKWAFNALQMAEKSTDKIEVPRVYANLSNVYHEIGEPGMAIGYLKKALLLNTTLTEDIRNYYIGALGEFYYKLGNYDSALYYLNKIYGYFQLADHRHWSKPDFYMGKIYGEKGKYQTSLLHFRNAIDIARKVHSPADLSSAYLGISETFKKLDDSDSSLYYAKQSFQIANEKSFPSQSLDAITFLSLLYESKHLIDSAFKYQKMSIAFRDSLSNKEKIKQVQNYTFNEQLRQQEIQQVQEAYQNKIKTYSLLASLVVFLIVALILFRNNKLKQKANILLRQQKKKIETTLIELKSTQAQLIQSEKMASLGELTAGIAHEIQNPLNFVNNFSELNTELFDELEQEANEGNLDGIRSIAKDIKENQQKINHHGKKADAIVKGMLQHSRSSSGVRESTDINALVEEYLRLAYHGLRAKDKSFNATMKTDFDETIGKINIIRQDIGRVILNLISNAFYAVSAKASDYAKASSDKSAKADVSAKASTKTDVGLPAGQAGYEPTVSVSTKRMGDNVELRVADNGHGIPPKMLDKIFQPFFTTKPVGQGTGLGLSLAYDIVKAHGGELKVKSKEGQGAEFVIQLPFN